MRRAIASSCILPTLVLAAACTLVAAPAAAGTIWTVDLAQGGQINDAYYLGIDEIPGVSNFTFNVTGQAVIQDLNLRLALTHSYIEDLVVSLIAPDGTAATIFSQLATGQGAQFVDVLFDDDFAFPRRIGSLGNASSPFTGSYQVQHAADDLKKFDGKQTLGLWTLRIIDNAVEDTGYVYAAGQAAPWGSAIGTQLIFTVPEPASASMLAIAGLALLRRRRR